METFPDPTDPLGWRADFCHGEIHPKRRHASRPDRRQGRLGARA